MKHALNTFVALAALLAAGGLGSCAKKPETKPVAVASMIDSEGAILGKMMVLMLEKNKIPVEDRTEFGTPDVLRKALEAGEVHLVLDYTGSGQYYHEGSDSQVWSDPVKGYEMTKKLDAEKNDLHWLAPADANNTESLAVSRAFAAATGVKDLPSFAEYVRNGGRVKLICSQSFADNPLGLIGLERAYGFKLAPDQLIILSAGNTAEMLKALSEGINEVNVSLVYGTDGAIDQMELLVLDDPRHVPPVYLPAPVLAGDKLREFPAIPEILKPVFESLTLEILQGLNARVAYLGEDAGVVAREYLEEKGFIDR
jgi:osmoprotectant transport system substrate-binding protein